MGLIKRAEEKDIDSILRRIATCETELKGKADQKTRIDEQGKRLEGCEDIIKNIKGENQEIVNRVSKLKWGLIVASLLAATGIALAIMLWVRSAGVISQGGPAQRAASAKALNLEMEGVTQATTGGGAK